VNLGAIIFLVLYLWPFAIWAIVWCARPGWRDILAPIAAALPYASMVGAFCEVKLLVWMGWLVL
jgi:hypothetical protein